MSPKVSRKPEAKVPEGSPKRSKRELKADGSPKVSRKKERSPPSAPPPPPPVDEDTGVPLANDELRSADAEADLQVGNNTDVVQPTENDSDLRPEEGDDGHLRPEEADGDLRPVSALSEEDIQIHENGELSSEGESDREDDAFDNKVPSPVVPCPYIDFVPLQEGSKDKQAEEGDGAVEKEAESGKEGAESGKEEAESQGAATGEEKAESQPDETEGEEEKKEVTSEGMYVCMHIIYYV